MYLTTPVYKFQRFILHRSRSEVAIPKTERDEKIFDVGWKQPQFFLMFLPCHREVGDTLH